MRLIDADKLKIKITGITRPHEFVEEIDKRPTVEAIPVEWIKRFAKANPQYEIYAEIMLIMWKAGNETN